MKHIYLFFLGLFLVLAMFITRPWYGELYDSYMTNRQMYSKGNFNSKLTFDHNYSALTDGSGSSGNSGTSSGSGGKIELNGLLKETPGQMQGLWSNQNNEVVTQEDMVNYCINNWQSDMNPWIQAYGKIPDFGGNQVSSIAVDKFKQSDGVGIINYMQWDPNYGGLRNKIYEPGSTTTLMSSGCGPSALACVYSTMLHRYISPPEVTTAIATYNWRYGTNKTFHASGNAGAMSQSSELNLLIEDMKYNGQSLFKGERGGMDKQKAMDTLNAGGMVIWVSSGGKRSGPYWGGNGGHWVIMREYDSSTDMFLNFDSANWPGIPGLNAGNTADPNTPNTYETMYNACKSRDAVWYITPGPGYQDYINHELK